MKKLISSNQQMLKYNPDLKKRKGIDFPISSKDTILIERYNNTTLIARTKKVIYLFK